MAEFIEQGNEWMLGVGLVLMFLIPLIPGLTIGLIRRLIGNVV